jgi:hypothetical protein
MLYVQIDKANGNFNMLAISRIRHALVPFSPPDSLVAWMATPGPLHGAPWISEDNSVYNDFNWLGGNLHCSMTLTNAFIKYFSDFLSPSAGK